MEKKKGNIIIIGLFFMAGTAMLAAMFVNIAMTYEVMNRVRNATQEGARVRAQAIDVPLKEQEGYVEIMHDGSANYNDNISNRSSFETQEGYVNELVDPNDYRYVQAKVDADKATKKAIVDYLNSSVNVNVNGEKMLDFDEDNVCIDVKALPRNPGSLTFSCSINKDLDGDSSNDTITVTKDVSGYDDPEHNDPSGLQVRNVVFVGAKFQYKQFIHDSLQTMLNGEDKANWTKIPSQTVYDIAYPQLDTCTEGSC